MPHEDRARLVEILESSRAAVSYAGNRTGPELEDDRMRLLAIIRLLEVIGEAANGISEPFRQAHPEIPLGESLRLRPRPGGRFGARNRGESPDSGRNFSDSLLH